MQSKLKQRFTGGADGQAPTYRNALIAQLNGPQKQVIKEIDA